MNQQQDECAWLAAELSKALVDRNEERFRTLAFWKRHVIIAALEQGGSIYDPRSHPAACAYHVDQYPHECTCGLISASAAGAGTAETRNVAQGEARQSGAQRADAQTPSPITPNGA